MTNKNTESTQYGTTFNDELNLAWTIKDKAPELLAIILDREPWVGESLDSINQCAIVANTCKQFNQPPYYRLAGHKRAFYIQKMANGGVFAIKGSELTALDINDELDEMATERCAETYYSLAEYFVFREQKIPMALLYQEAMEEAEIALELHTAYYDRYGELPQIPFPLSVLRWPDKDVAHFIENIKNYLGTRAFDLVQMLSRDGLAVYCYYYPKTPIRTREIYYVMQTFSKNGYAERMEELRKRIPLERAINAWITLLARMLGLGYLPVILANDDVGQAVRAQNVVCDGGFADVDSFQKIAGIGDSREMQESLWVMIIEFTKSIRTLMAGDLGNTKVRSHDFPIAPFIVGCRIRDELLNAIRLEKSNGVSFDPRIESALRTDSLFNDLDRDFRQLYPAPRRRRV